MTTMLKVDAVTRLFGGFKAVDGVSLQLKAGEILGIAGTNGAGKSTLFAAIAGQQPADAGQIEFDGQDITRMPPYRRARLGLVRTFQIPREFKSLTVHENLLAAAANPQGERLLNAFFQTRSRREHEAQLADKAGRDPSTVSRQIAKLERLGLVERPSSEADMRVRAAAITEAGARTVQAITQARRRLLRELVADWPAADQAAFPELLQRFAQAIKDRQG